MLYPKNSNKIFQMQWSNKQTKKQKTYFDSLCFLLDNNDRKKKISVRLKKKRRKEKEDISFISFFLLIEKYLFSLIVFLSSETGLSLENRNGSLDTTVSVLEWVLEMKRSISSVPWGTVGLRSYHYTYRICTYNLNKGAIFSGVRRI